MTLRLYKILIVAFVVLVALLGISLFQSLTTVRARVTPPLLSTPQLTAFISFGKSRGGAITANPYTRQIFAAQEDVPALGLIEAETNMLAQSTPLRGYHTGLTIDFVKNEIYVAQEFSQTVRVIDGATSTVVRELPVPGGSPIGELAFDPNDNHLYVIRNDIASVAVLDYRDGALLSTLPVDAHYGDLALNPQTQRLYMSSPLENKVTVVDTANDSIMATIPVGKNPKGVAVNPATNRVYVAIADDHAVGVIDAGTNKLLTTIPVGTTPIEVAVNPLTNRIYVSNLASKDVTIIDGRTELVVAQIPLEAQPGPLAVLADLNRVYVSTDEGHGVYVIQDTLKPTLTTLAAVSDETLRGFPANSDSLPREWNQPDFDDRSWVPSTDTDCAGQDPLPAYEQAKWVWLPNCTQHAQMVLFRKTFELPHTNYQGVLRFRADDNARLYLNGQPLGVTRSWTTVFWHDLSPYLRQGKNVLAIEAQNGTGGYGAVMFRADLVER